MRNHLDRFAATGSGHRRLIDCLLCGIGRSDRGIVMKPLLNVVGNSTKYTFEIPDFVFSTMPSGSARVTVTFLYSFPVTSLKSSAKATVVKHRIKKGRTFILQLRESFLRGRVVQYKNFLGCNQIGNGGLI